MSPEIIVLRNHIMRGNGRSSLLPQARRGLYFPVPWVPCGKRHLDQRDSGANHGLECNGFSNNRRARHGGWSVNSAKLESLGGLNNAFSRGGGILPPRPTYGFPFPNFSDWA